MKAQVLQFLRAGLRRSRAAINAIDPAGGNHSNPVFAYAELNKALLRLISAAPNVLRPSYTWGVLQGAHLAGALGIGRISVIEFGVAGGNGLVALELAAEKTQVLLGVQIDVHGFDTGRGLPCPVDYRDHPNIYMESTFRMDEETLRLRLRSTQLHVGLIKETIPRFLASGPSPIAFISFDLDYYSSTVDALGVLQADAARLLPRVHCYFDDIMGLTCSEWAGERLAINEFNEHQSRRKISSIFGLKYFL